jgi:hypothetical protein
VGAIGLIEPSGVSNNRIRIARWRLLLAGGRVRGVESLPVARPAGKGDVLAKRVEDREQAADAPLFIRWARYFRRNDD